VRGVVGGTFFSLSRPPDRSGTIGPDKLHLACKIFVIGMAESEFAVQ
jgi:hypothetical protein